MDTLSELKLTYCNCFVNYTFWITPEEEFFLCKIIEVVRYLRYIYVRPPKVLLTIFLKTHTHLIFQLVLPWHQAR